MYKTILLDLWGVVHDGTQLYPGVLQTLYKLKSLNKDIIFISNVPKRKKKIQYMLNSFCIDSSLYKEIVTSGELAINILMKKKVYGTNYFCIGCNDLEEIVISSDNYKKVNNMADAEFAIVTRLTNDATQEIECIKKLIKYNIPMLCINPDKVSIDNNGITTCCPGVIAEKYQQLGGKVIYFGKPYKAIYEYCLQYIVNKKKILAIGDSMTNDIKGAIDMNIDCALICGGIHRHELNIRIGEFPKRYNLLKLYKKYMLRPTFVLGIFSDII